MKKVLSVIMLAVALLASPSIVAQSLSKSDIKAAKSQAKQLKKEGWMPEGTTTIENAFVKMEEKRAEGADILPGVSYGSKKANVAKTKARNNAINEYAEYGKSIVKARINTKVDDIDGEEVDNIVSGYERMVVRELDGIITVPFLVLKRERDGKFDYQCYYVINANALERMRRKVLDQAIEDAGLAAKYGDEISNFVNAGFDEK